MFKVQWFRFGGRRCSPLNAALNAIENSRMEEIEIHIIGELPEFTKIAENLWGPDTDYDSDGDAINPKSISWSELTLIRRSDESQRIDIDPVNQNPKHLVVRSVSLELVQRVISYLQQYGSIK